MILKNLLMAGLLLSTLTNASFAVVGGDSGGGGDASEARVDEIRSDIFKWINNGGAKNLELPSNISYEVYEKEMKDVLTPKKVIVSFTDQAVTVGSSDKTCKGYINKETNRKHILCNIPRFQGTSESEQYSLIHHEFAGLVNVEQNSGESSDYVISNQLTDFLVEQTVLKLAIKKQERPEEQEDYYNPKRQIIKNVFICSASCNDEITGKRGHDLASIGVIYYADASNPENTNRNQCMYNSKEVEVFSDRMSDSVPTCAKAMVGEFYGKVVEIDTQHSEPGEGDTWFLSIKEMKKIKKKKTTK